MWVKNDGKVSSATKRLQKFNEDHCLLGLGLERGLIVRALSLLKFELEPT